MAMKWGAKQVVIKTDSATVHSWLSSARKGQKRLVVSGISEMLVKRRVALIYEVLSEYEVDWEVELVTSYKNIADSLTRVPKHWLIELKGPVCKMEEDIRRSHELHHRGVTNTLHFAKECLKKVPRDVVERVVKECDALTRSTLLQK
ncbi:Uncharacterized protein FKW44_017955 [Caligus rogercresseyi]|uniref:RNase H type-1 domain-containing protein n=1 Tax=Caligus rogercresseyi TaxID=217165 RepID=A0A7T8GTR5_CALRO|nr:Uncharacterized protein FKW44_017955 [Caligus rogercresseyi]